MGIKVKSVKNVLEPAVNPIGLVKSGGPVAKEEVKSNLSKYISHVQLQRIRYDLKLWRAAITEAEFAYYPQRVRMQQMYIDIALDGHIDACIKKRKRLTTLRQFQFTGGTEQQNELLQKWFKKQTWFKKFISYALDAEYYGYTLISLGDLVENSFPNLGVVKRWNVSPDRFNVTSYIYAQQGQDFRDPEVSDWHIYVDTPNEDGTSPCGYGLFYKIGIYAITLRNLLGFNSDFVERFGMPYVHVKTTKTDEDERGQLESLAANMGSAGYAVTDPTDEIEFLEAKLAANGFMAYDNLEQRCVSVITKMTLGHSDAMNSTPGKLGAEQGGEESPVAAALEEIKADDGEKIEAIINSQLLPKMRNLGFPIPEGVEFCFTNDKEAQKERSQEDENSLKTATIAKTMKEAGMEMDGDYWEDRTGIPFTKIETPQPIVAPEPKKIDKGIQNKLDKLYKH